MLVTEGPCPTAIGPTLGARFLMGGMACALGPQWWTKDSMQSVLIIDGNIVYSLSKQS